MNGEESFQLRKKNNRSSRSAMVTNELHIYMVWSVSMASATDTEMRSNHSKKMEG